MQSTDIGCKGNLFLNKLVGSCIIVVPKLQYNSGLKQMMEKMAEKLILLANSKSHVAVAVPYLIFYFIRKQKGSSAYLIEI
ncbi:unnamed protein product [Porites lobata]|uniref:Uncharacterized protein n=1 Tax=Porites lobata TaxID=104759 RepID=A0ABN8NFA0_9CNID|nr:unnamed protein product [Porites lobata]